MIRSLSLATALGIAALAGSPAVAAVVPVPPADSGMHAIDLAQYYERRYRDDDDYGYRRRGDWERRRYNDEWRRDRWRREQYRRYRDDDDD